MQSDRKPRITKHQSPVTSHQSPVTPYCFTYVDRNRSDRSHACFAAVSLWLGRASQKNPWSASENSTFTYVFFASFIASMTERIWSGGMWLSRPPQKKSMGA